MSFEYYVAYLYSMFRTNCIEFVDTFTSKALVTQISAVGIFSMSFFTMIVIIKFLRKFYKRKDDFKIMRHLTGKYWKPVESLLRQEEKASYAEVVARTKVMKPILFNFQKSYWLTMMLRDVLFQIEDDEDKEANMDNLRTIIKVFELDDFFYKVLRDGTLEQKIRITRTLRYFDFHVKNDEALAQMVNNKYAFVRKNAIFTRAWNDPNDALTYFNTEDFAKTFCRFDIMIFHDIMQRSISNEEDMTDMVSKLNTQHTVCMRSLYIREIRFLNLKQCCGAMVKMFEESTEPETSFQIIRTWGKLDYREGEPIMIKGYPFQSNRVKVAILRAVASFLSGKASKFLIKAYQNAYDYDIKVESIQAMFAYHIHGLLGEDFNSIAMDEDRDLFEYFQKINAGAKAKQVLVVGDAADDDDPSAVTTHAEDWDSGVPEEEKIAADQKAAEEHAARSLEHMVKMMQQAQGLRPEEVASDTDISDSEVK